MSIELLRHTVATVAYRGGKSIRGAPPSFAEFRAGETTRTPGQILAHIGDLFEWAIALADGRHEWHDSAPLEWEAEGGRFFRILEAFDARLASGEALAYPAEAFFQGPIADALTHVGQIAILRRIAGCPMRGENYFKADIAPGRVGASQAASKVEFD